MHCRSVNAVAGAATQRASPASRHTAVIYQFPANDILFHSIFDLSRAIFAEKGPF